MEVSSSCLKYAFIAACCAVICFLAANRAISLLLCLSTWVVLQNAILQPIVVPDNTTMQPGNPCLHVYIAPYSSFKAEDISLNSRNYSKSIRSTTVAVPFSHSALWNPWFFKSYWHLSYLIVYHPLFERPKFKWPEVWTAPKKNICKVPW